MGSLWPVRPSLMFGSINVVEIRRTATTEDDIFRLLGTKRAARRLSRGRDDLINEILRVEDKHLTRVVFHMFLH
jgi:hypothetical protein